MRIEEMVKKGGVRLGPGIFRKDFLKISGTGLAGASMLAVPGCGVFSGSGGSGGSSKFIEAKPGHWIQACPCFA